MGRRRENGRGKGKIEGTGGGKWGSRVGNGAAEGETEAREGKMGEERGKLRQQRGK